MPYWPDHALAVVLAIFFPLRAATFGYRRLVTAPPERVAAVRRSLYLQAIAIQWTLALAALAVWLASRRDFVTLGLEPRAGAGTAIGLAVAAAFGVALWRIRAGARRSADALDAYRQKLHHLERMLPRDPGELRLFFGVAVTAGICEELLYRGYLIWYVASWLGIGPAIAVTSAIFGLGHAYQGWKGVVATGVVGAVMAGVYLASGSLWPAMAIHALTDVHAGALAHAALSRVPQAPEPGAAATPDAPGA